MTKLRFSDSFDDADKVIIAAELVLLRSLPITSLPQPVVEFLDEVETTGFVHFDGYCDVSELI